MKIFSHGILLSCKCGSTDLIHNAEPKTNYAGVKDIDHKIYHLKCLKCGKIFFPGVGLIKVSVDVTDPEKPFINKLESKFGTEDIHRDLY